MPMVMRKEGILPGSGGQGRMTHLSTFPPHDERHNFGGRSYSPVNIVIKKQLAIGLLPMRVAPQGF